MTTSPYNWADDWGVADWAEERAQERARTTTQPPREEPPRRESPRQSSRTARAASAAGAAAGGFVGGVTSGFVPPLNVTVNGGSGGGRGGGGAGQTGAGPGERHQGDGMIAVIDRIEFRGDKDLLTFAKAVNRLGRELHFMLGMRAEEIQAVLSTYKGKWYTFGTASRVKARLVAMHLKVSAEAAKALGVGALKMAHAFDRHFVRPEQEAKRKRNGHKTARREFTIGDM